MQEIAINIKKRVAIDKSSPRVDVSRKLPQELTIRSEDKVVNKLWEKYGPFDFEKYHEDAEFLTHLT